MYNVPDKHSREKLHHQRETELLTHLAADFIARSSNNTSLITAIRTELSHRGDQATVFVSIFPDAMIRPALEFLNRNAGEFREYIKANSRMRDLPRIEFAFDYGEQNRQRLDELTRES